MGISSDVKLIPGKIYFYEYRGEVAIGEYFEETNHGQFDRYMHEFWCENDDTAPISTNGLLINRLNETLHILKEIREIKTLNEIPGVLEELRIEFPEHFL